MTQPKLIETYGITLKPLAPDLAAPMSTLANDPNIAQYLRDIFPHPYSYEHAVEFIQFANTNPMLQAWAIHYQSLFTGVISLILQEDIYRHSAEIGFWLGAPFHGKGIMTKAVSLVCTHAFDHLGIVRLFAGVFENNFTSRKVLLKNDFFLEGIRKKAIIKNGVLLDEYMMARLKDS